MSGTQQAQQKVNFFYKLGRLLASPFRNAAYAYHTSLLIALSLTLTYTLIKGCPQQICLYVVMLVSIEIFWLIVLLLTCKLYGGMSGPLKEAQACEKAEISINPVRVFIFTITIFYCSVVIPYILLSFYSWAYYINVFIGKYLASVSYALLLIILHVMSLLILSLLYQVTEQRVRCRHTMESLLALAYVIIQIILVVVLLTYRNLLNIIRSFMNPVNLIIFLALLFPILPLTSYIARKVLSHFMN